MEFQIVKIMDVIEYRWREKAWMIFIYFWKWLNDDKLWCKKRLRARSVNFLEGNVCFYFNLKNVNRLLQLERDGWYSTF